MDGRYSKVAYLGYQPRGGMAIILLMEEMFYGLNRPPYFGNLNATDMKKRQGIYGS